MGVHRRRRILLGRRKLDLEWPLHNLPDLQAWYTFDDADYLFTDAGSTNVTGNGDAIYQCNDRSGNDRHIVQATAANRPLWVTNARAGRPVAAFSTNDVLANGTPGAVLQNVPGATVVTVMMQSPLAKNGAFYIKTGGAGARLQLVVSDPAPGDGVLTVGGRRLDADSYAAVDSPASLFADGEWFVTSIRAVYSSSDLYIYYQGQQVAVDTSFQSDGNTSDTASSGVGLGVEAGGSLYLFGRIAEFLVCGSDIGLPMLRALWHQYLGPKWNLPV